jgi:CubicO group peptidase (beta-lactamase class C family)
MLSVALAFIGPAVLAQNAEPPTFAEVVQPYVDQGRFAGANGVVVSKDTVLAFPTVGYADVATKKPMQRDTMFWMASTSKPFQATALMMLVDEGKVKLDDPVSKYLPKFKPRIAVKAADGTEKLFEPQHPVTVRMLLNHTHGLSPNYSPDAPRADSIPLAAYVEDLLSRPLLHEPGTAFMYSDAGVNTASRIVEVVSRKSFEQFLDQRLLQPLGMKDTTYIPTAEQLARLATAYYIPPGTQTIVAVPDALAQPRPRAELADRSRRFAPQGGLFSTGGDLAKFAQMFLNQGTLEGHRYLSEWAVAEMTRDQIPPAAASTVPQPPPGPDSPATYGLGWGVGTTGAYFHPGMAMTDIRIDPKRGLATIFLPQHGGDATVFEIKMRLLDAALTHFDNPR